MLERAMILKGACGRRERFRQRPGIEVEDKALEHIVGYSKGDGRTALNVLEALYNAGDVTEGEKSFNSG